MFLFKWFSSLFTKDFFLKEKNQLYTFLFIFFLVLIFNFFPKNFFVWDELYEINFLYSNILKFNIFFLFDLIKNNFLLLLDLIFYTLNLIFFNNYRNNFNFDKIVFILNFYEFKNNLSGFNSFNHDYYELFFYKVHLLIFSFNENLHNIIIYTYNLPIFFYFGLLFILTTLFSLLLLSYLGLYGVFIINLFSLVLF